MGKKPHPVQGSVFFRIMSTGAPDRIVPRRKDLSRLLGAAFLLVFVASVICDILFSSAVGSGDISGILANSAGNAVRIRISALFGLAASLGIVALGALLHAEFGGRYRTLSLVALGMFWAEAALLAVSKLGAYALIPLGEAFVAAGSPEASHFQALGDFFHRRLYGQLYDIHTLFFCVGAILWYTLFLRSKCVPRPLAIWGLASVSLVCANILLMLFDPGIGRIYPMLIPYIPFELVIGIWLMAKGFAAGGPEDSGEEKRGTSAIPD